MARSRRVSSLVGSVRRFLQEHSRLPTTSPPQGQGLNRSDIAKTHDLLSRDIGRNLFGVKRSTQLAHAHEFSKMMMLDGSR